MALYGAVPLGRYLFVAWSTIATLVVFSVGLSRNERLRTAAAFAALLLAIYGLAANLLAPGAPPA